MLKKMVFWVFVFLFCVSTTATTQEKLSERRTEKILIKQIHRSSYSATLVYRTEISPDGRHMAYVAGIGKKWCVVVDGKEGKQYDTIGNGERFFSPDSKRVAYAAASDNKWFVVVDGEEEGTQYDTAFSPIFSPDSKRVAYTAESGKESFVVVDGRKEGTQYDKAKESRDFNLAVNENERSRYWKPRSAPVFSPDSKRVAYVACASILDNKFFVVVDGKEGKQYDDVRHKTLIFSPDSKRVAYVAKSDNKWFVVVDGKEEKQYDNIGNFVYESLIFSPDSKRVAYLAESDDKWFVVVDGKEGTRYNYNGIGNMIKRSLSVGIPVFSPDSKHVAYVAALDNKWFVVLDGKEGKQYGPEINGNTPPIFSPDSKHMAYYAYVTSDDKIQSFVVVDGEEGKLYDGILYRSITFSPDSNHVAYGVGHHIPDVSNKHSVVVDGKEGKQYDGIYPPPIFSSDSKHVVYRAGSGLEIRKPQHDIKQQYKESFVVVDGKEGTHYDAIVPGWAIVFDTVSTFHYLVLKGDSIYLVEERR